MKRISMYKYKWYKTKGLDKDMLTRLYIEEHMTMQEIGDMYKCSRIYICKLVNRYNISVYDAEHVKVNCPICNKEITLNRKRYKDSKGLFYCSTEHYYQHKQLNNYKEFRHGQRIARKIYQEHYHITLTSKQVIHHIDGNTRNNLIHNLMLFNSNAEHIAHHHQIRINSVKDINVNVYT